MAEIGKNIIENLTTGMYENSYTVYREYIQNAADSIDNAITSGLLKKYEAFIDIDINANTRRVSIYDNACGIPHEQFYKLLSDIADSTKDRTKEKGFRGIGRLAGIAYCDELIFSSSYSGEAVKSIMKWDGKLLRSIINDKTQHPSASDLVDMLITCSEEPCSLEEHFFEVVMDKIIPESDNLINEHSVIEYLQFVAPIPYSNTFVYSSKIYEFAKNNNFAIDEYRISINGNPLSKPYKTYIYEGNEKKTVCDEIMDVQFEVFENKKGEVLGWLWYGVSKFEKVIQIINPMRGIRLRKENIQIGSEDTLGYPKFFKESRGNKYFVGELFAVHPDLIPNARRDYFNINPTLKEFEKAIYPILHEDFYKLYHYANAVKTNTKKISDYEHKKQAFDSKVSTGGFISKDDQEKASKELEESKDKAEKAKHQLDLRKKDADKSDVFSKVYTEINTAYGVTETKATEVETKKLDEGKKKSSYLSQSLSRYSKKEQKLIGSIYDIIKKILPKDSAELVIQKIQEELK